MHIGPLGLPEIIIILVVVLLIFGPKNLPKLGKAIGRTVNNMREGMEGKGDDDEKKAVEDSTSEEVADAEAVEVEADKDETSSKKDEAKKEA